MSMMLGVRPLARLVPMTPTFLSPSLPIRPCHWKPTSAAFSPRDLDQQALDVDLGPARVELVDHRAHLPVQRLGGGDDQRVGRRVGLDEAAGAGARGGLDRRRGRRRAGGLRRGRAGLAAAAHPPAPAPPLENAARSIVASFTASAFFRCTTQIEPPGPPPCVGRSSLSMIERTWAWRAGLAARTISALLRAVGDHRYAAAAGRHARASARHCRTGAAPPAPCRRPGRT